MEPGAAKASSTPPACQYDRISQDTDRTAAGPFVSPLLRSTGLSRVDLSGLKNVLGDCSSSFGSNKVHPGIDKETEPPDQSKHSYISHRYMLQYGQATPGEGWIAVECDTTRAAPLCTVHKA